MDWVPWVFGIFKVFALSVAMYFAIKWHYDQKRTSEIGALLRAGGKMTAIFLLALGAVGIFAFALSSMLGLDLSLP